MTVLISTYAEAQSPPVTLNLLDKNHLWKPFGSAKVSQSDLGLLVSVNSGYKGKLFSRAILDLPIPPPTVPTHLSLYYSALSESGNTSFYIEIRENNTDKVVWTTSLEKSPILINKLFLLPPDISKFAVQVRLYVITDSPGYNELYVKEAKLSPIFK